MASNYPTSLDTATQQPSPTATTEMDDTGYEHHTVHVNHSEALLALETKLGATDSNAANQTVLQGNGVSSSSWTGSPTLSGTVTAAAFAGPLTGDASGSALTVTQAAQSAITSVGTMTGLAVNGTSQLYESVIEDISGNKTPALGDAGKVFFCSQTSGTQTITIDGSITWPLGTQMVFVSEGTSTVTFAESNSTDIVSKDSNMSIDGRWASAALIHYSTAGSGKWFLIGALA